MPFRAAINHSWNYFSIFRFSAIAKTKQKDRQADRQRQAHFLTHRQVFFSNKGGKDESPWICRFPLLQNSNLYGRPGTRGRYNFY